jgi:uncharacterized membrane protein
MAKNKQLVLGFFESETAADSAAKQLQEWDKSTAGIKFDNIGVLVKDEKGKIKTQKLGPRHTGAGLVLGGLAAVLTGGVSLVAGVAIGGAIGHFAQKGLGLSKEDVTRISGELDGGKAAVGVLVEETQAKAVTAWMTDLGGKLETYTVSEEAIAQAGAAVEAAPEATAEAPAAEAPAAPAAEAVPAPEAKG